MIPYYNKPTLKIMIYVEDNDIHSTAWTLVDPFKELFKR